MKASARWVGAFLYLPRNKASAVLSGKEKFHKHHVEAMLKEVAALRKAGAAVLRIRDTDTFARKMREFFQSKLVKVMEVVKDPRMANRVYDTRLLLQEEDEAKLKECLVSFLERLDV